jgi:hypothetical protein
VLGFSGSQCFRPGNHRRSPARGRRGDRVNDRGNQVHGWDAVGFRGELNGAGIWFPDSAIQPIYIVLSTQLEKNKGSMLFGFCRG